MPMEVTGDATVEWTCIGKVSRGRRPLAAAGLRSRRERRDSTVTSLRSGIADWGPPVTRLRNGAAFSKGSEGSALLCLRLGMTFPGEGMIRR